MATTAEILQQLIKSPDRLQALVEEAKMMAFERGILIRTQDAPNSSEVETPARQSFGVFLAGEGSEG